MILEIARIEIRDGREAAFEAAMREALELLAASRGFRGARLLASHERPRGYSLLVEWDTIENHTVDWQGSPAFKAWRALLADHFAAIPTVEHTTPVMHRPAP